MSEKKFENKTLNPEQILENGKNPGLGVRELHRQGINGSGVVVAIIDQKLDLAHPEYAHAITEYQEHGKAKQEEISMHGPAVTSLLAGKSCGVAPEASIIYKAVASGNDFSPNFIAYAQALNEITKEKKAKIVSISIGYNNDEHQLGLSEWRAALKRAKEAGLLVITCKNYLINDIASGGGSKNDKENPDSYLPWAGAKLEDEILEKLVLAENFDLALKHLRQTNNNESKNFTDQDLLRIFQNLRKRLNSLQKNPIIIPSDYRTIADARQGEKKYSYDEKGGLSWAIPYLAGTFALCLQVHPNLTENELLEILNKSVIVNKNGYRIINPPKMIELATKNNQK